MPTLIPIDREQRRAIGGLHDTVAWTIIVLAGCHALAGLAHHYWLKDGILPDAAAALSAASRRIPGQGGRRLYITHCRLLHFYRIPHERP